MIYNDQSRKYASATLGPRGAWWHVLDHPERLRFCTVFFFSSLSCSPKSMYTYVYIYIFIFVYIHVLISYLVGGLEQP